ncbi:SDR family oxidoreductase [Sphingomonas sp. RP10(2022)]|uniref:SDR family oxidoreductase n=1 Tax=Sphingomonas liriopis TaxID=2949094 RepID=A0A9X2KUD9_9SPHN|nr:SDR family oxidoreductase [Sphingomonas liriopis]MCP3735883.1 SDR family oxidoreductase [Sphingomonas liriopis]
MTDLSGKVAIVTGGGQGVGFGIASALAGAGARVMISGRDEDRLRAAVARIEGASCHVSDVRDPTGLDALVAATLDAFGAIDILVNNAQQVPLGRLADVSDEAFVAGFESGPLATFRLMKRVAPHMGARGGGVIFNLVSSAGVRWDMGGFGAYGAVKQATRVLTRAAASEWGADGIRVLSIAPHALSEAMQAWIEANPSEATAFFRTIPLKRLGDPHDDIGRAVVLLCDPAASYLTGATIPLDGGQANFD